MNTMKLSREIKLMLAVPQAVEHGAGQLAVIMSDKKVDVLAAKPHVQLANLRDDEKDITKFVRSWGPIQAGPDYTVPAANADVMFDFPTNTAMRALRVAHPDVKSFFSHTAALVIERRDVLRSAWAADRSSLEVVRHDAAMAGSASWGFRNGRIEIVVPDVWTAVCILFLNDRGAHRTGRCQWQDCPTPYYYKLRSDQKYCGGDCTDEARKEIKRDWWNKHRGKR